MKGAGGVWLDELKVERYQISTWRILTGDMEASKWRLSFSA
jgi:hypothetical protein